MISVQTDLDCTVEKFKLVLSELTDIPTYQQCLVSKCRVLIDSLTLRSFELEPGQTIHLLRRRRVTLLQVKLPATGSRMSVLSYLDWTVEEFKRALSDLTSIPSDQQCLIYKGHVLKNPQTIWSCELDQDMTIDLLRRSRVTLQVKLVKTGVKMPVRTDLNRTVEDFKRVLSYLTGMPSDQQILVYKNHVLENSQRLWSFELEPDDAIDLLPLRPPPTNRDYTSDIIESIPKLCEMAKHPACSNLLETTLGLHYALLYMTHCCFKMCVPYLEGRSTKPCVSRKIKAESAYRVHEGTPPMENQIALGLLGLKCSWTSGESSNANQKKSSPNSQHLPNPWAANYWEEINLPKEQVPESFDLVDKSHWRRIYAKSSTTLFPVIFSNKVVFGHCKERFDSVDRAFAVLGHLLNHDGFQSLIDSAIQRLVWELNEYFTPVLEMLLAAQSDEDHEDPGDEPAS